MPLQLTITGDTPQQLVGEMLRAISAFKGVEFTPAAATKSEPDATPAGSHGGSDGVVRQAGETVAEQPAKKRGRPPKQAPVAPSPAAVEEHAASAAAQVDPPAVEVASSPSTPAVPASDPAMPDFLKRAPNKDDARGWLQKVSETKNIEVARALIKALGYDGISRMPEDAYLKLIEACQKELAA